MQAYQKLVLAALLASCLVNVGTVLSVRWGCNGVRSEELPHAEPPCSASQTQPLCLASKLCLLALHLRLSLHILSVIVYFTARVKRHACMTASHLHPSLYPPILLSSAVTMGANAAFSGAAFFGVQMLTGYLKIMQLEKKELQLSGAGM